MLPTQDRVRALQDRFGVGNGQFFAVYKYKNLNWYLSKAAGPGGVREEWFCYGDIRVEDIPRLQALLGPDEVLSLGWKELGRDQKEDEFFGDGGGLWLVITKDSVPFDRRTS